MAELYLLESKMKGLADILSETESLRNSVENSFEQSNNFINIIKAINEKGTSFSAEIDEKQGSINAKIDAISNSEQEIKTREQEVVAFAENIEANKKTLAEIKENLSRRISDDIETKLTRATELIDEAEKALELKSSEGISRAYSSRFEKIEKSRLKYMWLIFAGVLLVFTVLMGYLLTGGYLGNIHYEETDKIAMILGRIAVTGISLSGAIFCANRFVTLRDIEEDYAYKVVLSKSILAFAPKIKELDEAKVAEYLNTVLSELHKDPLRNRHKEKGIKLNNKDIDTMEKLANLGKGVMNKS